MHILLTSNSERKSHLLKKGLSYEGLGCDFIELKSFMEIDKDRFCYDGVILHLSENDDVESLISFCKQIKENMIIIVAYPNANTPIDSLCKGHNIIVYHKPFPLRRIASEIRFMLFSQMDNFKGDLLVVRDLQLDVAAHSVKCRNKTIYLRNREFALLHYMMANRGKSLSRNRILENVWDRNANILTNTVDVHISQLRKKIEKKDKKYIRTIPCSGYMLD